MSKKTNRPTFKAFKAKALLDKKFREEYEALRPEFELVEELITAREKAHLTQTMLAKRLRTKQPAIARLEAGGYGKISIARLHEYANAIGYSLKIRLIPKKKVPKDNEENRKVS